MGAGRFRLPIAPTLIALGALAWAAPVAPAQAPPAVEPGAPTASPPTIPESADSARVAELEARVRQLEQLVQRLAEQRPPTPASVGAATSTRVAAGGGGGEALNTGGRPGTATGSASNTTPSGAAPGGNAPNGTPSATGGPLAPGQSSPPNPPPNARFHMPPTTINAPVTGRFGPGFEFRTADDEFVLQFHNLTQIDARFYQQGGQNPVRDTFALPRQWWIFSGRMTKPYEYLLSFQNAFDTINLLDVFVNVHYDDRLQIKLGRYKTPFTYEFYTEPVQGTINSELSLFFNNFALNRSIGAMAWGRFFEKTAPLDYAVGVFNSARNSYLDGSDGKNVLAYLNWRPFATQVDSPLENFVFGGSVMAGTQSNTPVPATLRTVVPTTGNSIVGVPFLTWNANTRENGPRAFWDLHAAWYYKQFSVIAEWQSGYQDFALATTLAAHNRVGVQSYYVQAASFLTGETVSGRGVVRPNRDFDVRRGKRGPGALELFGRFNALDLTPNVFAAGLADPNLWTDNLYTVEPGLNWYPNQYAKVTFEWDHAVFGAPVQFNATSRQKTSDLFWLRFQLYF